MGLENVKDGLVKNAYAKFLLTHDENTTLKEIDSKSCFLMALIWLILHIFPAIKNILELLIFQKFYAN